MLSAVRGRHGGGGWKTKELENLTKDTTPKKGFWTPTPSYGTLWHKMITYEKN